MEARFARHASIGAEGSGLGVSRGFDLAAEDGYRSPTVTSVNNTLGLDIADLNTFLAERGMALSDGYGPFKGKAFRIAHMGEVHAGDIERLLDAMDEYLEIVNRTASEGS